MTNLLHTLCQREPLFQEIAACQEVFWANAACSAAKETTSYFPIAQEEIEDAAQRLERFAPYIAETFPETSAQGGIIESPLQEAPAMAQWLAQQGMPLQGRLLVKLDSELPIAGSVKARGGIYEILHLAEDLAFSHGLLQPGDDYRLLGQRPCRDLFRQYTVQVGSTGNLGLSIGVSSAALGFQVVVHMSADAQAWKKDLLRQKGVRVVEYESDYSAAVAKGRALAAQDPQSYFVDDENSRRLFLGYSVAAKRLAVQLADLSIPVDEAHPLCVYLPCGIGGAPGGIAYGLKLLYGSAVHCFFVEPTHAPAMLVGMASGLHDAIAVTDLGIDGKTKADGLAVGRPSSFVGRLLFPLVDGICTVEDAKLLFFLRGLWQSQGIFVEPSAAAAFQGPVALFTAKGSLLREKLALPWQNATHIAWATGGSLVPPAVAAAYRQAAGCEEGL